MQEINVCVFCSSSNLIDKLYIEMADDLGRLIAENGFNLVHGGGKIGLMGVLSKKVQDNGGKVIGVLPDLLNIEGIASETDDEIIITKDMADRKYEMRKRSRAFIALPGGFGTLEEIMEIITLKQLEYHNYPIVFINTNLYYDKLFELFEKMYSEKFADVSYKDLYYIADTPTAAIDYIKNFNYPPIKKKWLI